MSFGGLAFVDLTGKKADGAKKPARELPQVAVRLQPETVDLIREVTAASGQTQAEWVTTMAHLDRELIRRLDNDVERARIRAYAEARGLDLATQSPQVLSALIVEALDCIDRKKSHKK